jgi:hypothetical protein
MNQMPITTKITSGSSLPGDQVVEQFHRLHPQEVHRAQTQQDGQDDDGAERLVQGRGPDGGEGGDEAHGHGGPGDDPDGPAQDAHFKADEVPERFPGIDIGRAVAREPAGAFGEAQGDGHHHHGHEQIDEDAPGAHQVHGFARQQEDA